MKISPALGLSALAVLSAGIGLFLLEQRNAVVAFKTRARLEVLERELSETRADIAAEKTGGISAAQRSAILKVIADDRAEQKLRQGEDQKKRFAELSLAQADRAARKYGLTDEQRQGLVDVLMQSGEKLTAMEAQMIGLRNQGEVEALAEKVNRIFEDLKAWRLEELTKRLGPEVAQRVNEDEFGLFGDSSRLEASRQNQ